MKKVTFEEEDDYFLEMDEKSFQPGTKSGKKKAQKSCSETKKKDTRNTNQGIIN